VKVIWHDDEIMHHKSVRGDVAPQNIDQQIGHAFALKQSFALACPRTDEESAPRRVSGGGTGVS
jgi:hypothetical protein